jgi:prophage antirepressor-like protein
MPNLIPFDFQGAEIVAIQDAEGNPWWKASDVCQQCDIKNVSKACERLDPDEKAVITLSDSAGRPQDMLVVNEPGLYTLALGSRKPQAKVFRRWITHEVVPQIRKTGQYASTPQVKNPANQMMIDTIVRLDAVEQRALAAEQQAIVANENSRRALETQPFLTIAEYVYVNKLQAQLPESAYKACSDHLRLYCLDQGIPFRRVAVGGKRWDTEYSFHVSVYSEVLPGWLKRRFAQTSLTVLRPS